MPLRSRSPCIEGVAGGAEPDQRLAGGEVSLEGVEVLLGKRPPADRDDDQVGLLDRFDSYFFAFPLAYLYVDALAIFEP